MQYSPKKRATPAKALMHDYFNDLRDEEAYKQISSKVRTMPDLFNYTEEEVAFMGYGYYEVVPMW